MFHAEKIGSNGFQPATRAAQPRHTGAVCYKADRSTPARNCRFSSAVEQRFCKPKVGGSIPSTGTKFPRYFHIVAIRLWFHGVIVDRLSADRYDSVIVGETDSHERAGATASLWIVVSNLTHHGRLKMSKLVLCASAALLLFAALPAKAQDIEVLRAYHIACDHGDRAACVRFGIMLGENRGKREEWRRLHPEFFWWEH
jgi:hypothetical protein